MVAQAPSYPARLNIDYPEKLNRVSTLFRLIWAIPIFVIFGLLTATATDTVTVITNSGEVVSRITTTGLGIAGGLFVATMLMIVFRQKYPRWWFDFALALSRFSNRIGAYLVLLTDRYPSTEAEQSVHLDFEYPDVQQDLNRWMPLVKWLLAIPHYIVLAVLAVGAIVAVVIAWFAILITGRYPRPLFDYVVGVGRWALRVQAYTSLLITDRYPPFSLS
jgi:prolipoprotein diacylglyceryltransferase